MRLKQIILNLLSNAYKFTKSGFIQLHAKCVDDHVEINVEDSGLGIDQKDYDLILREDSQLNFNQDYNSNGSGLGLSLSKILAGKLNYKLTFKSLYGKGSQFKLQMDCSKNEQINS